MSDFRHKAEVFLPCSIRTQHLQTQQHHKKTLIRVYLHQTSLRLARKVSSYSPRFRGTAAPRFFAHRFNISLPWGSSAQDPLPRIRVGRPPPPRRGWEPLTHLPIVSPAPRRRGIHRAASRGCIADPGAPADKSDTATPAASQHKEPGRHRARPPSTAPKCWTPSAASTIPSSTGGCRSRGWTWRSWRGWGSATWPSTNPKEGWASSPASGIAAARTAPTKRTVCCSSTALISGELLSPALAP